MRPLMRADLHVHSSASDGTDPPAEVMRRAARAGLDVVALTDHDTVAGHAEARARGRPPDPAARHGAVLPPRRSQRCTCWPTCSTRISPELAAELARIRDDRVLRARAMVDKLADLGVDISWDQVAAIAGRLWSAGRTSPAPWRPAAPSPRRARRSPVTGSPTAAAPTPTGTRSTRPARSPGRRGGRCRGAGPPAGGPGHLGNGRADRQAGRRGTGRPGGVPSRPVRCRTTRLLALAHDLDLVATGGSDDHGSLTGYRLGCEITPAEAYRDLLSRTPGGPAAVPTTGPPRGQS